MHLVPFQNKTNELQSNTFFDFNVSFSRRSFSCRKTPTRRSTRASALKTHCGPAPSWRLVSKNLHMKPKMRHRFTRLYVRASQSGRATIQKCRIHYRLPLCCALVEKKQKQNENPAACGHSGGNPPRLPPTALFPTEAVVTVESVCDALGNGGAIDLRRRRLSPLA